MNLIWGIILISISLKCWIGQIIITLSPKMAETIKIIEPESDVDQTFFTYIRSEAIWGSLSLWILPIAGILLIINNAFWTYFGLVGGGFIPVLKLQIGPDVDSPSRSQVTILQ